MGLAHDAEAEEIQIQACEAQVQARDAGEKELLSAKALLAETTHPRAFCHRRPWVYETLAARMEVQVQVMMAVSSQCELKHRADGQRWERRKPAL